MTALNLLRRRSALFAFSLGIALTACASTKPVPAENEKSPLAAGRATSPTETNEALTLVTDVSQVCMVNNQFMGRAQIPVQVDGKTYYGCCAMCKGRLESDLSTRTAIDPVSQASVDKATAIIGKTPDGSALYFASRDNFDSYARAKN